MGQKALQTGHWKETGQKRDMRAEIGKGKGETNKYI
jgi:hypothetical protein